MIKSIEKCSSYGECAAPLCPLSEELNDCAWYLDEAVCAARGFAKLRWLKIQKRIKKLRLHPGKGYFTRQMLDSIKAVSRGIKGIDPDGRASIDVWLTHRKPMPPAGMPVFAEKTTYLSFGLRNDGAKGSKGAGREKQLALI